MTFWISKTHVRIEPNEMTREEALAMAREIIAELGVKTRNRKSIEWSLELDGKLQTLRSHGVSNRGIAEELLGDPGLVGAISGRIKRLGLPVGDNARRRGLASQAARQLASVKS
jgi:hypothetical protein